MVIKIIYYGPLANGTAVNKGMSLAISCCQPPNWSAISLITLIVLVFYGVKDLAYTAKYGQPPEMKEGRGERDGNKGRGRGGVASSNCRMVGAPRPNMIYVPGARNSHRH